MKVLALLGPTASGKTALALELAARFPVEVVSVDSAQVYRGMDVGTAKPDAATRASVAHHLIDVVDPPEAYSAGRFRDDAAREIEAIHRRGRLPVLAGGTMLYFRALSLGLAELPGADPGIRAELERRAALEGWPRLHAELAIVDPASAARLEPTDAQRIQRALEVHRLTGRALSSFFGSPAARTPYDLLQVALEPSDRAVLHERIAVRFRAMIAAGLVEELESLRSRFRLEATMPSMRTVGYRQAWDTLTGAESLDTLEARGIAATRQLAKRQLTWLRSWDRGEGRAPLERVDCLRADLASRLAERVARFLEAPAPRAQSSP